MLAQITRLFRHRWAEDAHRTLAPDALQRLTHHVAQSERSHSGQIRICVEAGLPSSYLLRPDNLAALTRQRALAQFGKLRVWDTEHNNGVLIYLLLAEHAIELVADRGLNQHVPPAAWAALLQRLGTALRERGFENGLRQAVDEVTVVLRTHFPLAAHQHHPNELPDAPVLQ